MLQLYFAKMKHALPTVALSLFVLLAQISTLEHGVDHLSHDAQEFCKVFIGFEKSSSITTAALTLTTTPPDIQYIVSTSEIIYPSNPASYFVRAPPTSV